MGLNEAELRASLDPLRDELAALVAGNSPLSPAKSRFREAEIRQVIAAREATLAAIETERDK